MHITKYWLQFGRTKNVKKCCLELAGECSDNTSHQAVYTYNYIFAGCVGVEYKVWVGFVGEGLTVHLFRQCMHITIYIYIFVFYERCGLEL